MGLLLENVFYVGQGAVVTPRLYVQDLTHEGVDVHTVKHLCGDEVLFEFWPVGNEERVHLLGTVVKAVISL